MLCPWFASFSFIMLYVLLLAVGAAVAAPSELAVNPTSFSRKGPATLEPPALLCPKASDIFPCSCLHTGANTATIRCYEIRPTTDFRSVFQLVAPFQISALTIADSLLDHLPAHLLLPLDVNELHLSRVNSTRFSFFNDISRTQPSPKIFESLYAIEIDQATGVDKWDWSGFQGFKILDQVVVRDSSFPRLTKSFGSLPSTVKTIRFDLIHDMESIAYGALARLHNLETLKISNTPLQAFERNALARPASNLVVLDLSNNRLSSLSHDVFTDMPSLSVLSLNGNQLASLAAPTFTAITFTPQFKLYMTRNPFNCDCNLAWLNTMYKKNPAIFGNDFEMICAEPAYLQGEFLHALQTEDFECGKTYELLPGWNRRNSTLLEFLANPSIPGDS